jgi:hypothetical protein
MRLGTASEEGASAESSSGMVLGFRVRNRTMSATGSGIQYCRRGNDAAVRGFQCPRSVLSTG